MRSSWGDSDVGPAGYGEVNVNGTGAVVLQDSPAPSLVIGAQGGTGVWNQNAGRTTCGGTMVIGDCDFKSTHNEYAGNGTLNLNGGVFECPGITTGATGGRGFPTTDTKATIHFNGGALRATGNNANFIANPGNADLKIQIQAGGAIIDTNTHDITIGQPLMHDPTLGADPDGGVNKISSGMLTFAAVNSYTGTTSIDGGTLALVASGQINTSSSIENDATFLIESGTHTVGNITGTGTTIVNDDAQLTALSIAQDTLKIGSGATVTIQAIPGGPMALSENLTSVPEPSTLALLSIGAISLLSFTWRRQK